MSRIIKFSDPDPFQLKEISQTSREFRTVAMDNELWEHIVPKFRFDFENKGKRREPGALAKAFWQDYRAIQDPTERLLMRNIWGPLLPKSAIYAVVSAFPNNMHIVACAIEKVPSSLLFACDDFAHNRNLVRAMLSQDGLLLKSLPLDMRKDEFFVKIAVSQNGNALQYASETMQNNRQVVKLALRQNPDALQWASSKLRNDKKIVSFALTYARHIPAGIGEHVLLDPDICCEIRNQAPWILATEHPELLSDKNFVKRIVSRNGAYIGMIPDSMRSDLELAGLAIKNNGNAIWVLPEHMQANHSLILLALKNKCDVFPKIAQKEIHQDRQLALAYVAQFPKKLENISAALKREHEFLLSILKYNATFFNLIPKSICDDDAFVYKAVACNAGVLCFVPKRFWEHRDLMLSGIRKKPSFISLVPSKFLNDADFMAAVIEVEPSLFKMASIELRGDLRFRQRLSEENPSLLLKQLGK